MRKQEEQKKCVTSVHQFQISIVSKFSHYSISWCIILHQQQRLLLRFFSFHRFFFALSQNKRNKITNELILMFFSFCFISLKINQFQSRDNRTQTSFTWIYNLIFDSTKNHVTSHLNVFIFSFVLFADCPFAFSVFPLLKAKSYYLVGWCAMMAKSNQKRQWLSFKNV